MSTSAATPALPASGRAPVTLRRGHAAFTLMELIILLMILAILAGIALPVFTSVGKKGEQARALSNAKQIALALRLYASDNNGLYPSFVLKNGQPTTVPLKDSNSAFAQLFPTYVEQESIFWMKGSAFCSPKPPDEVTDNPPKDIPVETLKAGENEWAYVLSLTDSSNPSVPLIADGFADPVKHTYTNDPTLPGGVWHGAVAIVVHADSSGVVAKIDQATMTVIGPNGAVGSTGDIFTTAHAADGWLGPANVVVNPK